MAIWFASKKYDADSIEWKKPIPKELKPNINEGIVCVHGNLNPETKNHRVITEKVNVADHFLLKPQLWLYLKEEYPESVELEGWREICAVCVVEKNAEKMEITNMKQLKNLEKVNHEKKIT